MLAEVTVLAAAVSHAMGWRWPWRFRRARVAMNRAVSATVVSRVVALVEAFMLTAATIAIRTITRTAVTGISW